MWATQPINGQRAEGRCDWWSAGAAAAVFLQEIVRGGKTKGRKFGQTAFHYSNKQENNICSTSTTACMGVIDPQK